MAERPCPAVSGRKSGGEMTDKEPSKKRQLGVILLCILAGIILFMLAFHLYRHTFARKRWLDEPLYRHYMLNSLDRRHPLMGMTMEEAVALLGEEDSQRSSFLPRGGAVYPPETSLVYYIGRKYGEELWFILSFDKGVCVSYAVEAEVN